MVAQKSLTSLCKSMSGNLVIKKGDTKTILNQLIDIHDISTRVGTQGILKRVITR